VDVCEIPAWLLIYNKSRLSLVGSVFHQLMNMGMAAFAADWDSGCSSYGSQSQPNYQAFWGVQA
jgi:hypothetical protein